MKNATTELRDRFQDGRRRHVGNSSECYKIGNYHPIFMKIAIQTKKNMLNLEITKAEVQTQFQDSCRHFGNWSACYKMGNYHPILTQIGTQTKKDMLSSKFITPEVLAKFQQGRRRFGNWSACYKMGNYHPISMQIRIQTKKNMPSSEITKPEALPKFQDGSRRHFEIQVHAIKWAITTRFWWKSVHRLRKKFWARKSQKRKSPTAFKIAAAAMLELQVHATKWVITTELWMAAAAMLELLCYEMGNYHRTLMKIGTQTQENMLSECKNHKSESLRQKASKN
jgi:hypothetical protein